jgi:hypothetical protein
METVIIEAEKLQEETPLELPTVSEIKDPKLKSLGSKILKTVESIQKKLEGRSIISDSIVSAEKINWQKLDDLNHEMSALFAKRESLMEVLIMIVSEDK